MKKTMWAFWANGYGPFFKKPKQVKVLDGDFDMGWWSKCQNYDVKQIGLTEDDGYICFAHPEKEEVEKFIKGFMACRKLAGEFFYD